jgi:hypothetical protein
MYGIREWRLGADLAKKEGGKKKDGKQTRVQDGDIDWFFLGCTLGGRLWRFPTNIAR